MGRISRLSHHHQIFLDQIQIFSPWRAVIVWAPQVCCIFPAICKHERGELNLPTGPNFQFISIQNPEDSKDREKRRLARSHAVKQALQNRRGAQEIVSRNESPALGQNLVPWSIFAPPSAYGPFETLIGDSPRLRDLLDHSKCY